MLMDLIHSNQNLGVLNSLELNVESVIRFGRVWTQCPSKLRIPAPLPLVQNHVQGMVFFEPILMVLFLSQKGIKFLVAIFIFEIHEVGPSQKL